jgi:hypothetical protein
MLVRRCFEPADESNTRRITYGPEIVDIRGKFLSWPARRAKFITTAELLKKKSPDSPSSLLKVADCRTRSAPGPVRRHPVIVMDALIVFPVPIPFVVLMVLRCKLLLKLLP